MKRSLGLYWITIIALIVLIVGIELVLTGADHGLWGGPMWRRKMTYLFAFQPWLLKVPQGFWPGQAWGMFITHMFLHVDILHMAKNMTALFLLAFLMRDELSLRRLLTICLVSGVGGAGLFYLLGSPFVAMTGASGALSGLSVVWALGNAPGRFHAKDPQLLVMLAAIVALILLFEALPGNQTAWQAHLGGALTGAGNMLWRRVNPGRG